MSQTKVQLIKDAATSEDSIVHDGDTNTKIRFPAADTVSTETGGAERIRINSQGKVLVNTTTASSVGNSQYSRLEVSGNSSNSAGPGHLTLKSGTATASLSSGDTLSRLIFSSLDGGDYAYIQASADAAPGSSDFPGRMMFFTCADNASTATERMRIDSSGSIGVSTTSPVAQTLSDGTVIKPVLDLKGVTQNNTSGILQFTRKDNATQGSCIYSSGDDAGLTFRNTDGNGFGFYNGTTLALRIDTDGNFGIGESPHNDNRIRSTSPHFHNIVAKSTNGNGGYHNFTGKNSSGTTTFYVNHNGDVKNTNNSYGSISDVKLKENIIDAGSQLNDIKNIKVRVFNFKTDDASEKRIGVVAQEIETVCPKLVEEVFDRDSDGKLLETSTKSVKYSILYMKAIRALQEAIAKIEVLETKVAALEAA